MNSFLYDLGGSTSSLRVIIEELFSRSSSRVCFEGTFSNTGRLSELRLCTWIGNDELKKIVQANRHLHQLVGRSQSSLLRQPRARHREEKVKQLLICRAVLLIVLQHPPQYLTDLVAFDPVYQLVRSALAVFPLRKAVSEIRRPTAT